MGQTITRPKACKKVVGVAQKHTAGNWISCIQSTIRQTNTPSEDGCVKGNTPSFLKDRKATSSKDGNSLDNQQKACQEKTVLWRLRGQVAVFKPLLRMETRPNV